MMLLVFYVACIVVPCGQAHGSELARLQQTRWGATNLGEAMDCKAFLGSIHSTTITIATTLALTNLGKPVW
jgi:hypothetical protein